MTPLDLVLSGEYELCVPGNDPLEHFTQPFIRRALLGESSNGIETVDISSGEAAEIKGHPCVILGWKGGLFHYHTREWPVYAKRNDQPND